MLDCVLFCSQHVRNLQLHLLYDGMCGVLFNIYMEPVVAFIMCVDQIDGDGGVCIFRITGRFMGSCPNYLWV